MNTAVSEQKDDEVEEAVPPVNRMIIAVLALIGVLLSGYLLLHRWGVLGTLACGTGSCETVQTSPWATFLGVPVPLIGVVGYILLLIVAMIGLQPAAVNDRRIGLLLLVLSGGAFAFSMYLTAIEAFRIHAWCRYCVGSAIIITLIFLLSLPELARARVRHSGGGI